MLADSPATQLQEMLQRLALALAVLLVPASNGLPPDCPEVTPWASGIKHTPWWHTHGPLSDYYMCEPRAGAEEEVVAYLGKLSAGEPKPSDARPLKPSQYRDEFLHIAAEVPELAALFLPEDEQADLLPPEVLRRLQDLRTLRRDTWRLYWQRLHWQRFAAAPNSPARPQHAATRQPGPLGYDIRRAWTNTLYSDLGGARGCSAVQSAITDPRWSLPALSDAGKNEDSHFFLPAFLWQELQEDDDAAGPSPAAAGQRQHAQSPAADRVGPSEHVAARGQDGALCGPLQADSEVEGKVTVVQGRAKKPAASAASGT